MPEIPSFQTISNYHWQFQFSFQNPPSNSSNSHMQFICPMLVWRFDHDRSKALIPDLLSVLIVFAQEVPQHGLVALGIGQQVGVHVAHATDHGLEAESRPGDRKKTPMDHGWPWHIWEFQGGWLGLNQLKRSYTSIFLEGYWELSKHVCLQDRRHETAQRST